ncbi:hypothetical protein N6H14_18180 [Paenibacillus sp. CC-CFT747]|nr:hypothetical protein N6H14_18180 [Paenibacillus sp. CC-CFT747]
MAHLLLVDDDPNIVRITKLYLERGGYGVDTSLNGRKLWRSRKRTATTSSCLI